MRHQQGCADEEEVPEDTCGLLFAFSIPAGLVGGIYAASAVNGYRNVNQCRKLNATPPAPKIRPDRPW